MIAWRSIDTAPKDGVLVWGTNGIAMFPLYHSGGHWWVPIESRDTTGLANVVLSLRFPDPTHWVPQEEILKLLPEIRRLN